MSITIDMTKAKVIAHDARRVSRNAAFAPLDIKATIPAESTAAEAARAVIRTNDAALQVSMDAASDADALKALMPAGEQAMSKARDLSLAEKAPIASPVFTGNVGVGVTPEAWQSTRTALQVGDSTAVWGDVYKNSWFSNNVYRNTSGAESYINASYAQQVYMNNGGTMSFQVAPSGTADAAISWTTAMTIDNSGNVLVGTTSSSAGDGNTNTGVSIQAGGRLFASSTNDHNFNRNSSGQIIAWRNSGSKVGSVSISGSSTSYNTSSDYRLKTDVQPMTGATATFKLLKPVNFEWLSDGTRVDGFLAHELQEVIPAAATGTKDAMMDEEYEVTPAVVDDEGNETTAAVMGTRSVPDLQGIDQSKLVPLLTATIQELITRIEALEA